MATCAPKRASWSEVVCPERFEWFARVDVPSVLAEESRATIRLAAAESRFEKSSAWALHKAACGHQHDFQAWAADQHLHKAPWLVCQVPSSVHPMLTWSATKLKSSSIADKPRYMPCSRGGGRAVW